MTLNPRVHLAGAVVAAASVLVAIAGDRAAVVGVLRCRRTRSSTTTTISSSTLVRPVPGNSDCATAEKESAFTLVADPFVAAARRTEVSEVTALLAIGANKVWGISPSEEFLSGRFALDGTLREDRATWSGRTSYSRSSSLEQAVRDGDVVLARTYTDAAVLEGSYNYQLTDRWTIGASVGGYANWYDSVEGSDAQNDDWGYNVSGNLGYAYSDQTRLNYTLGYTYYASDITRSNVLTTTLGVVHRFSPQLTVSGSVGGFWSDTTAKENLPGQGTPIDAGENRDDSGTFFGGSIAYEFSESTKFDARASQGLAPSGIGTISKSTNASRGAVAPVLGTPVRPRWGRLRADEVPRRARQFRRRQDDHGGRGTVVPARGALDARRRLSVHAHSVFAGFWATRARTSCSSALPTTGPVRRSRVGSEDPVETQGLPGAGALSLPERPSGTPGTSSPISALGVSCLSISSRCRDAAPVHRSGDKRDQFDCTTSHAIRNCAPAARRETSVPVLHSHGRTDKRGPGRRQDHRRVPVDAAPAQGTDPCRRRDTRADHHSSWHLRFRRSTARRRPSWCRSRRSLPTSCAPRSPASPTSASR